MNYQNHETFPSSVVGPDVWTGKEMLDKAVNSGKVSAADVAIKVFDAIVQNQFYIFSHPKSLDNVQERMQAILDNKQPPNPFSKRPEIGEELKAALRSAT